MALNTEGSRIFEHRTVCSDVTRIFRLRALSIKFLSFFLDKAMGFRFNMYIVARHIYSQRC